MQIMLVDAKNCTYRHGYTRANLRNSEGKPTGAIYGVLSCLYRLRKYYPKAKFVFCWDGEETWKSWRHKLSKTYKANRHKPGSKEMPFEVKSILSQIPAIKKGLDILGIEQYEVPRLEADDLIGILAHHYSEKNNIDHVYIYSMDKDMYQLINHKVSVVRDLDKAKKCKAFTAKDVLKEFGVTPKMWTRYRALIGDPSDGIKAPFPKVGKVRALKLLAQGLDPGQVVPFTKLENQYAKNWKHCRMNYRLSNIIKFRRQLYKNLSDKQIKLIDIIIDSISKKKLFEISVKKFIAYCSEYELNWILENRVFYYRVSKVLS